jgi:hypothetical protein
MTHSDHDRNALTVGAVVKDADGASIGSVERIAAGEDGSPKLMIARHGYADYLLAVPSAMIDEVSGDEVRLNVSLQRFEELLFEPGGDAGPAVPSESVDEVLGHIAGESPLGPATG